ncbi:MAG: Gfo/Idh/MocA family oxidoreductase [Bacteroidota bacterium]
MKNTINWGIIGAGKIANKFATDIKVTKNAKLRAVASRSLPKAQDFAHQHDATHAFGSYKDLLDCPDLDAVYVASPHTFHAEHSILCMNAGLHVLCEKPLAVNTRQVEDMIETAKKNKVFLMEALWTRFLPTMSRTQELIDNQQIGEVYSVRADFGFRAPYDVEKRIFNRSLGGGALLDIGIYPVFLAYFLFGYPDDIKVSARIGETGIDEEIAMIFKYKDGRIADLHSTVLAYTDTEAFIYGSEGTIKLNERWFNPTSIVLSKYDADNSKVMHDELIDFDYRSGGFEYEIEAASEAILLGKQEEPRWTWQDSLNMMKIMDAIRSDVGVVYPADVK